MFKLTAIDIKKIVEIIWCDSDFDITFKRDRGDEVEKCVEYLGVKFYTYKTKATSGAYALVRSSSGNAIMSNNAGYAEKKALIDFVIQDEKSDILDCYTQKISTAYLGKLKTFNFNSKKFNAYLDIGHLEYTRQPELTSLGSTITCSLEIKISYSTNVLTGGEKVWLLDNEKIPFTSESVDIDKMGNANSIFGAKAAQTLPTMQTKYYRFVMPYIIDNSVCIKLQKDILDGDLQKVYTLKYYDGISYTEAKPYKANVTLCRTAKIDGANVSDTRLEIWLTETDDDSKSNICYEMALIDNQFDNGSINVRYFEDRASQQAWHAHKIQTGAPYSPIKAPNLNSLTITQQIYHKPSNCLLDLNSLLTKNYAIIKAIDKTSGDVLYYYYYIQSASGGSENQIFLSLQMDTIQTYYYDPKITVPDCLIERAHLNRWVDNGDGTVKFDNGPESVMLNNETQNIPKRLVSRKPIFFGVQKDGSDINNYLQNHRISWLLVYMLPNEKLKAMNVYKFSIMRTDTNLVLLIAPIYVAQKQDWYVNDLLWRSDVLFKWIADNALTEYIVNMKITPICPLGVNNFNDKYEVKENGNININIVNGFGIWNYPINDTEVICVQRVQSSTPSFYNLKLPYKNCFMINEIVGVVKNYNLNPKILSPTFKEFKIADYSGNSFSYDIQKINREDVRILCTECLSSDITKGYIRLDDFDDSCYSNGSQYNLTGLVYSNDISIPFSVDQLSKFLAQNKNYALMQQANRDYTSDMAKTNNNFAWASGITSGLGALPNPISAFSHLVNTQIGTEKNTIMTNAQNALSSLMQNMTLDNMRAAPADLKNAQGNIMFCDIIDEGENIAICVEFYEAITQDAYKILDYMSMFGFIFKRIGKLSEFDNIRTYFNYVQAEIENIFGIELSNDARNDIRRRFANGIRFWNVDEISYDMENYERWLKLK